MPSLVDRNESATRRGIARAGRYRALEFWRRHTSREGGRWCLMPLDRIVRVVGTADGSAHLSGIRRCASTWCCPVCTPTIRERRAAEIDQGVSAHLGNGGSAYLVTATLSHNAQTDLSQLLDIAQRAWTKTFVNARRFDSYVGQVRAWDFTHGANGWHPHIHAIVLLDRAAASWLWQLGQRWGDCVAGEGGSTDVTSARSPGWDVRPITDSAGMSDYLCKVAGGWGAGLELARADIKKGSRAGSTPAQLLEMAVAGDRRALGLVQEFERATAGRRAVVWGRGLKALLGVEDISDDVAAVTEPAECITVQVAVPGKAWRRLLVSGEASALVASVGLLAAGLDPGALSWRWPHAWVLAWRQTSALPSAA